MRQSYNQPKYLKLSKSCIRAESRIERFINEKMSRNIGCGASTYKELEIVANVLNDDSMKCILNMFFEQR